MYLRSKTVRTKTATHEYVQLVTSSRENGKVVQRVVATLGRRDQLQASGGLDRLAESLGRFTERVTVLDALADGTVVAEDCPEWGPALVFGRLWDDLGLRSLLRELVQNRGFSFDVERIAFAMALQRLVHPEPGSDRNGLEWLASCRIEGINDGTERCPPQLQYFYRTAAFLAEHKDEIERRLWARGRTLFDYQVDVALFDTTNAYFEGEGPDELAKLGKSKEGRYDCPLVTVGVVLTGDGWPLCSEVWPGNMSDAKTVLPILDALKKRFSIRQVVFIADRCMVSKDNLAAVREAGYDYIVGCKMRGDKEVREHVLSHPGRYHKVADNLRVKQVVIEDKRYIICHNPLEAERDRQARDKILAALKEKVAGKSAKKLTANRGYKRFLKTPPKSAIAIDEDAVRQDARYDGKYVLRTSTAWSSEQVAVAYKSLRMVERFFRDYKGLLNLRPFFHKRHETLRGHILGCFLALYLAVALRKSLAELGKDGETEWARLVLDLRRVRAVTLRLAGRAYLVRSELHGAAHLAFRAAHMKPPPRVQPITTSPQGEAKV